MKRQPHHFYSDLYFQNFYFCPGWKKTELQKRFAVELDESCRGVTMVTEIGIVIWIEEQDLLGSLAHECVHAAKFLFKQKGVISSNENDEPLAYLVQWIFENCEKKLKRKR
jgi:hypothetical protein